MNRNKSICITSLCLSLAMVRSLPIDAQKVTFHDGFISLKQAFEKLESVSTYKIAYNDSQLDVSRKVLMDQKEMEVLLALSQLLKNTGYTYKTNGNYILIVPEKADDTTKDRKRVSGVIVDNQGIPVIGANVVEKGTANGTITDIDGKFTLEVSGNATLQVSYIGYNTQELSVLGKTDFSIKLGEDTQALDEVVVVGYGTQKKITVTGAVSSVGTKDILKSPVPNIAQALTGKVPGLSTIQYSGQPGADDPAIFVRGIGSLDAKRAAPLVMVDGVERSFFRLDPNEIENITVLKDASATAVYGVRGANGVILVTTRRGREGETQISFSSEFGVTSFNRISQTLNSESVSRFMREGAINDGFDPSDTGNTRGLFLSEYDNYLYRTQKSPFTHPDNDFVDMFTKNGLQQKYNVNLSGGNKTVRYFVSVGYFTQTGMFETDVDKIKEHETIQTLLAASPDVAKGLYKEGYNSEYKYSRLTTRSNIDINLTEDFKVSVNLAYRFGSQNRPYGYDADGQEALRLFGMFYRNSPQAFPILNANGTYAAADGIWRQNPLVTLCYSGFFLNFNNKLETDFAFKYNLRKLLKGLSIDGKFSYDAGWSNNRSIQQRPNIYQYNPVNGTYKQGLEMVLPTKATNKTAATHRKYAEAAVRYKQSFSGHNISGLVLYNMSYTSTPGGRYSYVPHIYQALVGRVNYDYENRYLFEVNAGYNGSNRFAEGHRYQLFPAASVGWVLTNEPFFKENPILSFTKLRFSYGEVGNDKLGGFSYYYRSGYDEGLGYTFGETHNPAIKGLIQGKSANENITWEVARKYNLGLETKWLKDKISASIDFFKERRSNILCEPERYSQAAGSNGLAPINYGVVTNQGYDLEIGYQDQKGDFGYSIKGIYGYAHNEIVEKSESVKPYAYMSQTGNPIGQFIGYISDGFFSSYEDVASSPVQFGQVSRPGDIKYKDLNHDGVIDSNDQAPIGYNPVPEMTFSLAAGLNWKGIDFSILLQGAARSSIYLQQDIAWDNFWGNYYEEHIGRWTPETAATSPYPRFTKAATAAHPNYYKSDYWLKDSKYLRLKNIQLGYTIPRKLLKKFGVRSLRVYANAYNLFTWDNVKKVDPESSNNSNGQFYPQQKVINFGINLNF